MVHANLIAHYPVRDEIYLHTSSSKDGSLHIALGTNRRGGSIGGDGTGCGAIDPESLEVLSVPSYDFLSKSAKRQGFSTRLASQRLATSPSMAMDKEVAADEALVPALSDQQEAIVGKASPLALPIMPALSLAGDGISAMDAVFDEALDDTTKPELFSKSGVTRAPEGVHFTLQGLEIFINNAGEALIQGTQTDFSKPIFLSWGGAVIFSDVNAKALQVRASRICGIGRSTIEELVIEGFAQDRSSTFVNGGSLTAKALFLKNLTSNNNGSISAPNCCVDGQLKSQGSLASDELLVAEDGVLQLDAASTAAIKKVFLGKGGHLENHATAATTIEVLHSRGGILTSHGPLMVTEVAAESAFQAIYSRHTLSFERGDIQTQRLENAGSFTAATSTLQVLAGRNQQGLKTKNLEVDAEFINEASAGLVTEAVSGTGHFHNFGKLEIDGQLSVGVMQFTGVKGSIKAKSIIGQDTLLTFTNLEDSRIEVVEGISFAPTTKVIHRGELTAKALHLVSDNTSQYDELNVETLTLTGVALFANHGTINAQHLEWFDCSTYKHLCWYGISNTIFFIVKGFANRTTCMSLSRFALKIEIFPK